MARIYRVFQFDARALVGGADGVLLLFTYTRSNGEIDGRFLVSWPVVAYTNYIERSPYLYEFSW